MTARKRWEMKGELVINYRVLIHRENRLKVISPVLDEGVLWESLLHGFVILSLSCRVVGEKNIRSSLAGVAVTRLLTACTSLPLLAAVGCSAVGLRD